MPALIFDLDGTLVDTVYAHVFAWQQALAEAGMAIDGYRIHRHIGMSGTQFIRSVQREAGRELSETEAEALYHRHEEIFRQYLPRPRPFPGAVEMLRTLVSHRVPHAIATASHRPTIDCSLEALGVGPETVLVDGQQVRHSKPSPDIFLASQKKLEAEPSDCFVIGDAVWDMMAARRAGMFSIGLLTGGYGEEELFHAGAFRVFRDPADLLLHLDELGTLEWP
jgi:HAD superfamily hydrolase (TIGR01509 family)